MSKETPSLLADKPKVICAGLASFVASLEAQAVPVVGMDWRPPAGGDPKLLGILEQLMAW